MEKIFYIRNRLNDGRVQDNTFFTWGHRRKNIFFKGKENK